jgi:protein O-mannosyl-transferase
MAGSGVGTSSPARWLPGLLLVACVLAVFLPALSSGYVWDDHIFFGAYPADVYFASWLENGREPFAISANYFRPVAMLTFLADGAAGPGATLSHFINVTVHALNATLAGFLAWRLLSLRETAVAAWIAAAAGLWYGLHPALIEAAAMVMCRFDLVATTFSLVLLHVSLATGRWVWPAVGVLFLAALLSKESAAGLLVAWPLWVSTLAWLRGSSNRSAIVGPLVHGWAALGAGVLLCVIARFWVRGYVWAFADAGTEVAGAYYERVAMSMAQQIRLMVLPFGAVDPFHTADRFSTVSYIVALAAIAAAGIGATRAASRPWAALVVAGIAALAPSSNVMPIPFAGGVYTADRYLTLPLVFLVPVVAAVLHGAWARLGAARRFAAALLLVWLLGAVAVIRATLPLMHDDVRFWTWVAGLHPAEIVAQANLADALVVDARFAEAIQVLRPALEKDAGNAALWHNLARAYDGVGQPRPAMEAIDRALAIDPADENFWHTKAILLAGAGDLENAERIVRQRVLSINPALVDAHLNLIRLLLATDRTAEAESYVRAHGDVFVGQWRQRARELLEAPVAPPAP